MDLMQTLMEYLSGRSMSQISNQLGADQDTTNTAISAAIPALISAIAKNASQRHGAEALSHALEKHDGSLLNNLPEHLASGGDPVDAAAILRHVLGGNQIAVEDAISRKSGLDPGMVSQLLRILAPLVMGALGRTQRSTGLDTDQLGPYLQQQHQQAESAAPDIVGMVSSLLDSNKDGSVVDDIGRIAGNIFSKKDS